MRYIDFESFNLAPLKNFYCTLYDEILPPQLTEDAITLLSIKESLSKCNVEIGEEIHLPIVHQAQRMNRLDSEPAIAQNLCQHPAEYLMTNTALSIFYNLCEGFCHHKSERNT